MEIFLEVQRQQLHVFVVMAENHTVSQLKEKLTSLFSVNPDDMRLHAGGNILDDSQMLKDAGFMKGTCEASHPGVVGLSLRSSDGQWEELSITPVSDPPPLPDVLQRSHIDSAATRANDSGTV
uniref:Ubiquitin-like domain-containing protein n=1 Tax=Trichuris muris TaxID=70415 RepID=A0A5S6QPT7_TRIMR